MSHTDNQINARCHLQVSKALEIIGAMDEAEIDRELAYQYAHTAGMNNEVMRPAFRCDEFLIKAYRDGREDAIFQESMKACAV